MSDQRYRTSSVEKDFKTLLRGAEDVVSRPSLL